MKISILTGEEKIKSRLPVLREFICQAGVSLPFASIKMSSEWWLQFHSRDDSLFGDKRGKNFLGSQCRLENFSLFLAEEDNRICGFAPLYTYRVNCSGYNKELHVLSFASDYVLAPYQDFFILPDKRKPVLSCLSEVLQSQLAAHEYDLVFLGYISEDSPNIPVLRDLLCAERGGSLEWIEAVTSQRGGVWPWTIGGITKAFRQVSEKCSGNVVLSNKVQLLADRLEACTPTSFFFPATRSSWLSEIESLVADCSLDEKLSSDISQVSSFLKTRFLPYPYIELPATREEYLGMLSRSTRRYFRRYTRKWKLAGGWFECIPGSDIQAGDIDDYIRLHQLRWGNESAALSGAGESFHRNICQGIGEEGLLSLFFATWNGRRIAAQSCLDMNLRREGYLSGRDPRYQELRAGRLLYMETIYDAIDHGFTRYDMGALDFSYKKSFATGMLSSRSFFLFNAGSPPDLERLFPGFECMVPV